MSDYSKDNEIYQGVINALNYKNLKARAPQPGETLALGNCTVKVLGPIHHYDDPNNNSIILKVTCGKTSFMFVGDAEEPVLNSQSVANAAVEETAPLSTGVDNCKYVKNTNTLRFHLPQCDSVKDMKEKNKAYSNQTREEIIAEGYKPCSRCLYP